MKNVVSFKFSSDDPGNLSFPFELILLTVVNIK